MHLSRHARLFPFAAGFLCLWAALFAASGAVAPQSQKKHASRPKTSPPAKLIEAAVPFLPGEKLDYRVLWTKFAVNAASVRLAVLDRRPFYGQQAWHFQALARTVDTMRLLFPLDDQFDSYTETVGLTSLQFEMYLREQGKQQDSVLRMTTNGDPAPGTGAAVRVLPGTRDALGFLQYLRAVDWQRNKEVHCPVFEGRKLYEVKARLTLERGDVTVPAGKFTASRIALRIYEHGREVPQTSFEVWLAQDATHTPVLLEVEVPFGNGRVELTRVQQLP